MNVAVFNLLMVVGLGLVGTGVGLWSIPAALVTVGLLLLTLTLIVSGRAGVR